MSDIFISYARSTSAAQAQAMANALRALGYDVWFDEALPAHRDFGDVLAEHLRTAKAVVVIWSNEAVKSQWVRSEANRAREAGKLVQLVIDDAVLPMPFDQIHCADMKGWRGDTAVPGWKKVVASIADLLGAPNFATIGNAQTSTLPIRKNSICVLPFVNMSGDAEQEYFSDGISEDIITDLSKVSALFVIARNTAFTFKAKSVDVAQVARQLNVSHVLEGSVRKAGGRVRITAQLIDGVTGGHVWAERYDRDLNDIFALQDEISEAIVDALKLKLLPEERASMERRGTANLEAYDLYLRGTRPAFARADKRARIALFEAATRIAPDYADAWGELAKARALGLAELNEDANAASAEAERALALDPHNIAALGAQFYLVPSFGRFADQDALLTRMEAIAPRNSDVLTRRDYHLKWVGRIREAIDVTLRAFELSPLDPFVLHDRARRLFDGGRYAEARRGLEDVLSRWPDHRFAAFSLLQLCVHSQDWAKVDALLARFPFGDDESARAARWYPSVMRDRSPESRRRPIDRARRRFETSGTANFFVLQVAAQAGDSDEAHAIALRARFDPSERGNDAPYVFDAMFPEFRRDPRFVKLCARCGLVDYWLTTQHWPDCVDEVAPYYDFKAECERVAAGPPLPPANEAGSHS